MFVMRLACRMELIGNRLLNVLHAVCQQVAIGREYAAKCFVCGLPAECN
jgi:hypothetical protein